MVSASCSVSSSQEKVDANDGRTFFEVFTKKNKKISLSDIKYLFKVDNLNLRGNEEILSKVHLFSFYDFFLKSLLNLHVFYILRRAFP